MLSFISFPEYYNQPLEANTNYRAFLRGFITSTKYSSTNWIDFKTKEKDTGLGAGAIVGIVFGVILFIALIAAIGYFVKKRIDDEEKNCETGKKPRRPSLFKGSFHKHETGKLKCFAIANIGFLSLQKSQECRAALSTWKKFFSYLLV